MNNADVAIEQVDFTVVMYLRHKVLWPDKAPAFCKIEGDEDALHFAAFYQGHLASVASCFVSEERAQLRKFATDQDFQGQGIGTKLIQYVCGELMRQGASLLWCDARASALSFYRRLGFDINSEPFDKHGLTYYKATRSLTGP